VPGRRDYYPQYYRAKRRRERAVLAISTLVIVVVGLAFIIFLSIYLSRLFRHPSTLEEMAAQTGELAAPVVEEPPAEGRGEPTGIAEDKAQPKLVALEDITEYAESVPEVSIIPQGLGTPPAAETEESLTTEEEVEPDSSEEAASGEETEQAPHPEPRPAPEPEPAAAGSPSSEESERPSEKPAPQPSEKKEPQKPARAVPQYTFTVFAGVYKEDGKATREMSRLRELGFKPGKLTRSQGGKKSYLVYVGEPLPDYELAEAVKKKLQEAGFSDAYILRKSTN